MAHKENFLEDTGGRPPPQPHQLDRKRARPPRPRQPMCFPGNGETELLNRENCGQYGPNYISFVQENNLNFESIVLNKTALTET